MTHIVVKPTDALARKAVTSRRIQNPGVQKLRKKADEAVGKNSDQIASALVKEAEKGNASSARLLVDLADGANWTEHVDSVAKVISLAVEGWKNEPKTVEIQTIPDLPRLKLPPRQLTDGKSGVEGSESGSETDSPDPDAVDAQGEAIDAEFTDAGSETADAPVPGP